MSDSLRTERLAEALLNEVRILQITSLKEPRVQGITFTRARLSKDLRLLRLYFTLEDRDREEGALAGLEKSAGFIKREMAKKMTLKFVPQIEFFYDESEILQERTTQLLKEIR